jgi:outer membrane protein
LKNILTALLAATCLMSSGVALAEIKVGFVNSQRILADAPQAAKAKKKIEKEFEKRDQDLQRMARQLQSLQESLEKNGVTMPESERRTKEREFAELNREFQRRQREFKEDLNLRQNEEMAAIFDRVNKVIKNIAETEKYDLILQDAIFAGPRIDITERIIKLLGDGGGK